MGGGGGGKGGVGGALLSLADLGSFGAVSTVEDLSKGKIGSALTDPVFGGPSKRIGTQLFGPEVGSDLKKAAVAGELAAAGGAGGVAEGGAEGAAFTESFPAAADTTAFSETFPAAGGAAGGGGVNAFPASAYVNVPSAGAGGGGLGSNAMNALLALTALQTGSGLVRGFVGGQPGLDAGAMQARAVAQAQAQAQDAKMKALLARQGGSAADAASRGLAGASPQFLGQLLASEAGYPQATTESLDLAQQYFRGG